ncbi:BMC domain-containing protein [Celerinatantimonas sp. MCCC 1A17872]|uniref:BMC domain-containing protein n=1 Tax=Celerinatantimonas sp. MCCC 1A17872 TaxID=3177514 RepID=UPI0038CA2DA6
MSNHSLGLIETVGLTAAIEAADAAVKSANVTLIGYELTKGNGLVTVKLEGDVGAINAAVASGVAAANRMGKVWAHRVIARTANGLDALINTAETVKAPPAPTTQKTPAPNDTEASKSLKQVATSDKKPTQSTLNAPHQTTALIQRPESTPVKPATKPTSKTATTRTRRAPRKTTKKAAPKADSDKSGQ